MEVEARVSGREHGATIIVGLPDRAVSEARERVRAGVIASELWWPQGGSSSTSHRATSRSSGPVTTSRWRWRSSPPPTSCRVSVRARAGARRAGVRRAVAAGARCADRGRDGAPRRSRGARLPERLRRGSCAGRGPARLRRPSPDRRRRLAERRARAAAGDACGRGTAAPEGPDLADVRGQPLARRALELAAVGGHNMLMIGPPGVGKTMLARRLPGLLPALDERDALEVTRVHSAAGVLRPGVGRDPAATLPRAAPRRIGARADRRRRRPAPRRDLAGEWRRPVPRRADRVLAQRARGAAAAARGRRAGRGARGGSRALPRARAARRGRESLSVRRPGRLHLHARSRRALPRPAERPARRPARPRRARRRP